MTEPTTWDVLSVPKVSDGDTVRLIRSRVADIDGRHYRISDADPEGIAIRLVWLDTPERGDHPGWENARADLLGWINERTRVVAGGGLRVICFESAGWDRLLGDLIDADGASASQWMMAARGWPPYTGKAAT